jgi:hypothetical protein
MLMLTHHLGNMKSYLIQGFSEPTSGFAENSKKRAPIVDATDAQNVILAD